MELATEVQPKNNLPAPAPEADIYNNDVKSLFDSIQDEKEQFNTSIRFEDTPPEEEPKEEPKSDKKVVDAIQKLNDFGASTIIKGADSLLAFIASMIAMEDPDKFHADEESKKDLTEILKLGMPDYKEVLPWWAQLAILAPTIYGPIIKSAFDARKANKKIKEQEDEITKMKLDHAKEIDRLKHEKAVTSIKAETGNIESQQAFVSMFSEFMKNMPPEIKKQKQPAEELPKIYNTEGK